MWLFYRIRNFSILSNILILHVYVPFPILFILQLFYCYFQDHHSQGEVIACLEDEIDKVSPGCQKAILRAAELQSDDYHLDRPLFHSCQEARERFCHDVKSGEGRVYKCLMRHMSDPDMNMEVGSVMI